MYPSGWRVRIRNPVGRFCRRWGSNPHISAKKSQVRPQGVPVIFLFRLGFEPVGLSVKQNSPVNCFVARGGEIGTAAIGWGDEPRNFTEIAKSPHLRQKFSGALMCAWNFYLKKGIWTRRLERWAFIRCKANLLYQPAFAEHSGNLSTFSIVVAELILEVKSRWA